MTSKQKSNDQAERICFVIAPLGDLGSPERRRSDQVLKYLIEPATKHCGYRSVRSDQMEEPGLITSQIVDRIINAPMVVADLTGRNPNVFYELALRHALGKPVVQLMAEGQRIPFDVASQRTIFVNHQDLDSVEEAKARLVEQIKAAEKGARADNPITVAVDLQALLGTNRPEGEWVAALLEGLSQIRVALTRLDQRVVAIERATVHTVPYSPGSRLLEAVVAEGPQRAGAVLLGGGSLTVPTREAPSITFSAEPFEIRGARAGRTKS